MLFIVCYCNDVEFLVGVELVGEYYFGVFVEMVQGFVVVVSVLFDVGFGSGIDVCYIGKNVFV